MSTATQTRTLRATPAQTILSMLGDMKDRMAERRAYGQTVRALSQLSDHELTDLGLSRHTIRADAWQAVYGTRARG